MNLESALACGFRSDKHSVGKSLFDVARLDSAYHLINNCKQVIAQILGLSYRTIEESITNIKIKLNVSSKSELIEISIDHFLKI
jgi:hypothetical protein